MGIQFDHTPRIEEGYSLRRIHRQAEVQSSGDEVKYYLIPLDRASRAKGRQEQADPHYANGRAVADNTKHNWQDELEESEDVARGGLLKPFLIALLAVLVLGGIGLGVWKFFLNPNRGTTTVDRGSASSSVSAETPAPAESAGTDDMSSGVSMTETAAPTTEAPTAAPETTPAETTPAETTKATTTMYVNVQSLNVRNQAGTDGSTVLGSLPFGTAVEVIDTVDGWSSFDYNGTIAYAYSAEDFMTTTPNN